MFYFYTYSTVGLPNNDIGGLSGMQKTGIVTAWHGGHMFILIKYSEEALCALIRSKPAETISKPNSVAYKMTARDALNNKRLNNLSEDRTCI